MISGVQVMVLAGMTIVLLAFVIWIVSKGLSENFTMRGD